MDFRSTIVTLASLAVIDTATAAETPPKVPMTHKECLRFMAPRHLKSDDEALFKLAMDSTITRHPPAGGVDAPLLVVELNYFARGFTTIRGAAGNGPFYLFLVTAEGLVHVGTIYGSTHEYAVVNGKARFVARSHVTAFEYEEDTYDWDGESFALTGTVRFRYNPDDGTSAPLQDDTTESPRSTDAVSE